MDEEAGTTVTDAAGSNPGVHVGAPVHEAGEVGRALRLDGSRSFVAVQDNDLWAFGSSDFTIELWANFATPGGGSVGQPSHVFISNDESPGHANKWFFSLGGGFLNFLVGPGEDFFPLVPFSPQVGHWYHLAIRRAGSTYTIFIDGEPAGSAENLLPVPNANALLTIGEAEGQFHMNGLLDEVTIYNRGLDDTELKSIFQAGSAGKCKPPKITTRVLTSAQLGQSSEQTLRAEFGAPPYTWSLAGGSLPLGISLSGAGVLSGTPQETGNFTFIAGLVDNMGGTAQASLSLDVLLVPPPPDIRVKKVGNIPVPGRSVNYFIVLENVGGGIAENFDAVEVLEPEFQFRFADPPPNLTSAVTIRWNVPALTPGDYQVLTYSVRLDPTVPLGTTVSGQAYVTCPDPDCIAADLRCQQSDGTVEDRLIPCRQAHRICTSVCGGAAAQNTT